MATNRSPLLENWVGQMHMDTEYGVQENSSPRLPDNNYLCHSAVDNKFELFIAGLPSAKTVRSPTLVLP